MFEKYLEDILKNTDRLYYNFNGINRKQFPKWQGWKIISEYKESGVDINDIHDERLDTLVRNFYLLKYIDEIYYD